MTTVRGKCLGVEIRINPDREVVLCDGLEFPWTWKPSDGYFLVRIDQGLICVGYVGETHELNLEFRGSNPDKITKEIVRRNFLTPGHLSYIAGEVILAHHCLVNQIPYVQR
ncbi:MAG: hypothetical protein FJ220_03325 [Kiritimatiellaceae bacterium]|nr:hypothetical protein [Kiritimatiellaceae bacterium]